MKKILFYFMYATWIFYILFFTSFLASWRVPTVITFAAAILSPHSFLCTDTVLKFKLPQPLSFYLLKSMSVMWYA